MGTRVIVTGAASGIGAGAVERLRARGAQVVGLDLHADEQAGILACDVRDQAAVDGAVAAAIERLGVTPLHRMSFQSAAYTQLQL